MVVCKFFQQGNCRNGQNCRFEHIYGSKYSYHANPPVQANTVTDDQLINQVQSDVQAVIKGGQWILSSYAPFKEKPNFPGLPDLSPEEARLFIYEAKANNNIDQAVAYMDNLIKETMYKYELLMHPNINIKKVLQNLYKGEQVSSPFTQTSANTSVVGNTNASSLFRTAVQNPSVFSQNNANTSIFSQRQSSPFGQTTDAAAIFAQATTQNVFGSNQTPSVFRGPSSWTSDNAKSIFAQASKNVFGASENQNNASNVFASASQSFFGQNDALPQNTSPFSQSQGNVFQKTESSVFSMPQTTNVFQQPQIEDVGVYSKMEDLTAEDLEAFKSDNFKLGFVPEIAPPHSLCI